jgi:transformation/transcription domain-associated protein
MMIEYCSLELIDHRKDLIKFAWNQLKSEETTTKHWAYANICRFISAYDTPPKITLQVLLGPDTPQ